jgi:signal transduction protein with GAF and PtsI domain
MSDIPEISDPARLKAVRATGLVDSAPEADFDRLARIAARLLAAPAAFVTVIDQDRQYLKSAVADDAVTKDAGTSTDLDRSFCKHAVASNEPFVVDDARMHPLVKDNKAVGDGVIAYAGVPFESPDGQPLGALCVVDSKPREWSEEDIENLRAIGRAASQLVSARQAGGEGGAAQHPPKADDLTGSVAAYLRAERAYSRLLEGSRNLDMAAESEARGELVECTAALRRAHERGIAKEPGKDASLLECVGRYLEAEQQRESLAAAFSAGTEDLAKLEVAIERQMDAADALRICALDFGVEP